MSQYTEYIKEAARDFEEIERFETVSCLYAQDGRIETRYIHGGSIIQFTRDTTYKNFKNRFYHLIHLSELHSVW